MSHLCPCPHAGRRSRGWGGGSYIRLCPLSCKSRVLLPMAITVPLHHPAVPHMSHSYPQAGPRWGSHPEGASTHVLGIPRVPHTITTAIPLHCPEALHACHVRVVSVSLVRSWGGFHVLDVPDDPLPWPSPPPLHCPKVPHASRPCHMHEGQLYMTWRGMCAPPRPLSPGAGASACRAASGAGPHGHPPGGGHGTPAPAPRHHHRDPAPAATCTPGPAPLHTSPHQVQPVETSTGLYRPLLTSIDQCGSPEPKRHHKTQKHLVEPSRAWQSPARSVRSQ